MNIGREDFLRALVGQRWVSAIKTGPLLSSPLRDHPFLYSSPCSFPPSFSLLLLIRYKLHWFVIVKCLICEKFLANFPYFSCFSALRSRQSMNKRAWTHNFIPIIFRYTILISSSVICRKSSIDFYLSILLSRFKALLAYFRRDFYIKCKKDSRFIG